MTFLTLFAAGSCLLLAAMSFYLANPHQKLMVVSVSRSWLLGAFVIALIAGLVLLMQELGKATAVFIAMSVLMLFWSFLPLLLGYLRRGVKK